MSNFQPIESNQRAGWVQSIPVPWDSFTDTMVGWFEDMEDTDEMDRFVSFGAYAVNCVLTVLPQRALIALEAWIDQLISDEIDGIPHPIRSYQELVVRLTSSLISPTDITWDVYITVAALLGAYGATQYPKIVFSLLETNEPVPVSATSTNDRRSKASNPNTACFL